MESGTARRASSDVFISYSRHDGEFVRRLYEGLRVHDRTCWVDWEGIPPSARWMEELRSAIESSQAFVFVISPSSVESEVCRTELEHAAALNKRIVPIVAQPVADTAMVPAAATERNWLFFDDEEGFDSALERLIQTLDTDPEWTRLHTRLLMRAVEWDSNGRDASFALRGSDLRTAETWITRNDARKDPQPTPLHTEYIVGSRAAATRTQRRRTAALGVGFVVASVLAVLAFLQFRRAEDEARIATSRELASTSLLREATDPDLGLTLAVEAGRVSATADADQAMRQALEDTYVQTVLNADGIAQTAVSVSADETRIAAGGNGSVRLWDLESTHETIAFEVPGEEVEGLAFNPDGDKIAVASGDSASIVDAATGEAQAELKGHVGKVWWVSWDEVGEKLVSAGADGTVRVWRPDGTELSRTTAHRGAEVFSAEFDPSGNRVVSGGRDGFVRVWDARSGREAYGFEVEGTQADAGVATDVNTVAFSPDGKSVVAGADDGSALVWALEAGARPMLLPAGEQPVYGVAFRPDGERVAVGSLDGALRVWDITQGGRRGVRVSTLLGHRGGVNAVDYVGDGRLLASASGDGSVRLWLPEPDDSTTTFAGHSQSVLGASFSPDGETVATTSLDGSAKLWSADGTGPTLTMRARGAGAAPDLWSPGFDPEGIRLVAGVGDGTARIWDTVSGDELTRFEGHRSRVVGAAFSPDGQSVVTSSLDRNLAARVWDADTARETASFAGHGDWVFDVSWDPAGERIVSAGAEGVARIWDAATGDEILALEGHRDYVRSAEFSPDGGRVITGGEDRTARLWDADTGEALQVLRGHTDAILSATFSPDGSLVATGGPDRTVRVWDSKDGRLLDVLHRHEDWVNQVEFSPDGSSILTASYDDTASILTCALCVPFEDLLDLAESRVTRELSPEERAQYLHE